MRGVILSRRAVRDVRRIGRGPVLAQIEEALERLAADAANLDIKLLAGAAPWRRLRVGDYRVLYRPIDTMESGDSEARWLVARIVDRRDLERAVSTLK